MSFAIRHFTNSFFHIEGDTTSLACDPWCTTANYGGWHAAPPVDFEAAVKLVRNCSSLYISHLHSDHFSPELLDRLDFSSLTVFVKNFKQKTLYNLLAGYGPRDIIELDPWDPFRFGEFELVVVPQSSQTSSGIDVGFDYDLDTSLLVRHVPTGYVFFNMTDNPLGLDDLRYTAKFAMDFWHKQIDFATLNVGAASEWPQCFPLLNRSAAKKTFIEEQLNLAMERMFALGARRYIIAGGRYCIPGKFHQLNQYLAIPTFNEICTAAKAKNSGSILIHNLEGGGRIHIQEAIEEIVETPIEEFSLVELGEIYSNLPYDYDRNEFDISADEISELFSAAKARLSEKMAREKITAETVVEFFLYDDLRLDANGNPLLINRNPDYRLFEHREVRYGILKVHLDRKAFVAVLRGKILLNQLMAGSLALQEREPDVFLPTTQFALNFFRV